MGPPAAVAGGGCWGLWGLTRMRATGAFPQGSKAGDGGSSASDEGSVPMVVGGTIGSDHFPIPSVCSHPVCSLVILAGKLLAGPGLVGPLVDQRVDF